MGKKRARERGINCLVKIRSHYPFMKKAEQKVADFILKNDKEAVGLPITEVARRSGVSVATVSRFYQNLSFDSYQDFRIRLAQDLVSPLAEIYEDIEKGDSSTDIIQKVFRKNIESLRDTQKILDTKSLLKAARAISKAKAVHLFGIGGSAVIARDARIQFLHLGISTSCYDDVYLQLLSAISLKRGEVAIGISHSGKTKSTVDFLSLAKKAKATTICITNYANSPITKVSDICLLTAFRESKVQSAAISSRIAQLSIVDVLYILVAMQKSGEIIPQVREIDEQVERYLRYAPNRQP